VKRTRHEDVVVQVVEVAVPLDAPDDIFEIDFDRLEIGVGEA
jgi:hypothetical protein